MRFLGDLWGLKVLRVRRRKESKCYEDGAEEPHGKCLRGVAAQSLMVEEGRWWSQSAPRELGIYSYPRQGFLTKSDAGGVLEADVELLSQPWPRDPVIYFRCSGGRPLHFFLPSRW